MTFRLRLLYAVRGVAIVGLIAAAAITARQIIWHAGLDEMQRKSGGSLALNGVKLEAAIAPYNDVPYRLSQHPEILALLKAPKDHELASKVNRYLHSTNKTIGARALYVMDLSGTTLAASNYAEPISFVGQWYKFRPYFEEALETGQGGFYGIGVTTGEPGYYLSRVIKDGGTPIGVAVVKIDLRHLPRAWREAGEDLAVLDHRSGILCLTSVNDWEYRPLQQPPPEQLRKLEAWRQYEGVKLGPSVLEPSHGLPTGDLPVSIRGDGSPRSPVLLYSLPLNDHGFTLIVISSVGPLSHRANLVATVTALTLAFFAPAGLLLRQRRQMVVAPEYFVSYAWGDATPEGKEREAFVDRLCAKAAAQGIAIIRDKTAMTTGDRISKFMLRLGRANRVFVVLSDKYLKSPLCMFELFEVWRNCRSEDEEFLRRIRVFTLPCAKIKTPVDRTLYAAHWRDECGKLDALVRQYGYDILGERDAHQHRLMKKFANEIGDILWTVADTLNPSDFEEFKKYGFSDRPPDAPE
jgi:hypothetical protein